jgi:hypothetical protein
VSKCGIFFSKNAYSSKLGETLFPSIFKAQRALHPLFLIFPFPPPNLASIENFPNVLNH